MRQDDQQQAEHLLEQMGVIRSVLRAVRRIDAPELREEAVNLAHALEGLGQAAMALDASADSRGRELKRCEERRRRLLDDAPEAFVIADPHGRLVEANARAAALLGYDAGELGRLTILDVFDLDDIDEDSRGAGPFESRGARRLRCKDSVWRTFDVSMRTAADGWRHLIVRDDAERRRSEEALREQEHTLRMLLNSAPGVVCHLRPDLTVAWINEEGCRFFHQSFDDLVGSSDLGIVHEDERSDIARQFAALGPDAPAALIEHRTSAASGAVRHLERRCRALFDAEGVITGYLWIGGDATDARARHEALAASEARRRMMLESVRDAVMLFDAATLEIIDVNAAAVTLYGWRREALTRLTLTDLSRDPDLTRRTAARAAIDGGWVASIHWHTRFDGSVFAVEMSGGLCTVAGRPHICAVARDADARLRAEEARARVEAHRADSARLDSLAVFAGEMAHDFNDVLTSLVGQTSLALARVSASSPAYRHVKAAEAAALRAVGLTDELQMCAGKGRAAPTTFDINGLVEEMEEHLHACAGAGVELRTSLAAVLPAIEADPAHIRRMIQHLVVELADEEQDGDERRTLWLTTGASYVDQGYLAEAELGDRLSPGSYVWVEIRDPARTLDEAGRRRLFDPTSDPSASGRGIGLAAALGVLRAHGGAIRASSDGERGLTLRALLPASAKAAEDLADTPSLAVAAGRGAVLVVDDDDLARDAIREMVEQAGFTALTAADGETAIDLWRRHEAPFAAAIVDASMPGLDGGEVLRAFRRLNPDLPVLMMSGYAEQDAADRGALEGAAGFLQKPFGLRRLAEQLTAVLQHPTVQ